MIDNWDYGQSDGRPNIMEGSGYGGGKFSDDWARWGWRMRAEFIAAVCAISALFVGMLALAIWIR